MEGSSSLHRVPHHLTPTHSGKKPPPVPPKSRSQSVSSTPSTRSTTPQGEATSKKPPPPVAKKPAHLSVRAPPPPLPDRPAPPKLPERARLVAAVEGLTHHLSVPVHHHQQRGDVVPVLPTRPALPVRPEAETGQYRPPPPPSRTATPGSSPQPSRLAPPRRGSDDVSSDPEDELADDPDPERDDANEPHGLRTTLSTSVKRALDEYPDASRAHRRAPEFVPRQYVSLHHHIHGYAVCGHRLVLAAHVVKVYDLTLGDAKPVVVWDPKTLPGEGRREVKVTSVSFRALRDGMEEGRFVWCGLSTGFLVELDTFTGETTQFRAAHAAPVTHIFRYKRHMISLDETGKLHVFTIPTTTSSSDANEMNPTRTIRTAERPTFVRMLGDRLWTASGPLTRSTTNPSLRGPTIRVYEPLGIGTPGTTTTTGGAGRTTYTSEWTGAVTSLAVLSTDSSRVYLAHEGGYISVFHRESLACEAVLKVSSSDVLALEGVGGRLWAGYRTGVVCVYEVGCVPWVTVNMWMAHPDVPIQQILVDKLSVEETGRFAVWTWARDKLHAWDGLLSADWIETRLEDREAEYSSHSHINVLICSWNIDSCKPSDLTGPPENTKFLEECIGGADKPEIIIFGFQEVIDLNDRKLAAKTMLFGRKDKHDGRGSAGSVSPAYARWRDKLAVAVRQYTGLSYVMLDHESLVGLMTVVFVKNDIKGRVTDASITTVKRGMGGTYGNKGAIVARCVIDDSSVCFVNVHLAAGQTQRVARNADLAAIFEDKSVLPVSLSPLAFINGGDGTRILDHETIFLNGDLNYRIDQRRENVIASIEAGDLAYLLEHDQLRKEMKNNSSFRLRTFKEAPIHFAPTYKYMPNSREFDQSAKKRIPAWCDRVLWKTRTESYVECVDYKRYEPMVSDHRPISARFNITVKSIAPEQYAEVRQQVADDWFKQEGALIDSIMTSLDEQ